MSVYYMNDAAFDLPDIGLVDRTVHQLEALLPEGDRLALSVHRAPLPEGKTVEDLVADNLRNAALHLRGHAVLFRQTAEVDGQSAIEIGTKWQGEEGAIYTRQCHLSVGGAWLVFAGNAPLEDRAACDEIVERALSTFRARG